MLSSSRLFRVACTVIMISLYVSVSLTYVIVLTKSLNLPDKMYSSYLECWGIIAIYKLFKIRNNSYNTKATYYKYNILIIINIFTYAI